MSVLSAVDPTLPYVASKGRSRSAERALRGPAMTPVSVHAMAPWLAKYPRRVEAELLFTGFRDGFVIPFIPSASLYLSKNLKSVSDNLEVARKKLQKEVELGRMAGPFAEPPFENLRVSPLGLVPKRDAGKFRMIHHLSFPDGESVNDGISRADTMVSYTSFDVAVQVVRAAGPRALLAKTDIESAFRLLPVHPDCFHLLGCALDGLFYVDKCLPMGCSISCRYFETFSTFLEWVVRMRSGVSSVIHYLDDFLFVGPAGSGQCSHLLQVFKEVAVAFGVPIAEEKSEGPVTKLSFLGIEIDTVDMVFQLPTDKLERLLLLVQQVLAAKKITLRQLQSLLGLLVFACRIIPMGRVFSRRLSLATRGAVKPSHFIRVSRSMKDDLRVWIIFLSSFNGRAVAQDMEISNYDFNLYTDASGSVGFGSVFGNDWCMARWPARWYVLGLTKNLTLLELFPIVVAVELWSDRMANRRIRFWSDNMSVVQVVNSLSSSSLPVLSLLRHLVFLVFTAEYPVSCKTRAWCGQCYS
ncbi:RNA-mediated [Pristimantis euphronides]